MSRRNAACALKGKAVDFLGFREILQSITDSCAKFPLLGRGHSGLNPRSHRSSLGQRTIGTNGPSVSFSNRAPGEVSGLSRHTIFRPQKEAVGQDVTGDASIVQRTPNGLPSSY